MYGSVGIVPWWFSVMRTYLWTSGLHFCCEGGDIVFRVQGFDFRILSYNLGRGACSAGLVFEQYWQAYVDVRDNCNKQICPLMFSTDRFFLSDGERRVEIERGSGLHMPDVEFSTRRADILEWDSCLVPAPDGRRHVQQLGFAPPERMVLVLPVIYWIIRGSIQSLSLNQVVEWARNGSWAWSRS